MVLPIVAEHDPIVTEEPKYEFAIHWNWDEYVVECVYEDRGLPRQARFHWDARQKRWVTRSARVAARLLKYADAEAKRHIIDTLTRLPSSAPGQRVLSGRVYGGSPNARVKGKYRYNM
jgi:hypothetical protein